MPTAAYRLPACRQSTRQALASLLHVPKPAMCHLRDGHPQQHTRTSAMADQPASTRSFSVSRVWGQRSAPGLVGCKEVPGTAATQGGTEAATWRQQGNLGLTVPGLLSSLCRPGRRASFSVRAYLSPALAAAPWEVRARNALRQGERPGCFASPFRSAFSPVRARPILPVCRLAAMAQPPEWEIVITNTTHMCATCACSSSIKPEPKPAACLQEVYVYIGGLSLALIRASSRGRGALAGHCHCCHGLQACHTV